MERVKAIQLAQVLTAQEWKLFKKWVQSPWCNTNKNVCTLYLALEKGFPEFKGSKWTKEKVYARVFPDKAYHNRIFNNLLSEFYGQLKKFLAHQYLADQKIEEAQYVTRQLVRRNAQPLMEKSARQLLRQLEEKHPKSGEDYFRLYQLYHLLYHQPDSRHRYDPDSFLLEKSYQALQTFYQLESLKYQYDLQTRQAILKAPTKAAPQPVKPKAIELFEFRLNMDTREHSYWQFKEMYYGSFRELPPPSQQYFLFCCINDCVRFAHSTTMNALAEMLHHYQFGIENKLLLKNKQITGATFNNIVLVASHLKDHHFAASFIREYLPCLPKKEQNDARVWSTAVLLYIQEAYQDCIDHLYHHNFDEELFKIQSKGTILRAGYEQFLLDDTHFQLVWNLCDNYEKFFHRHKFHSQDRKNRYIRFVQFLRKILSLFSQTDLNSAAQKKLEQEILDEKQLFGKYWLLQKIRSKTVANPTIR